ncbi:MAG: lipolytic enzyme, G-D-S-L [Oscillospiraceae bacterium]|nr:lipolytic enzyme, G-D-S-L [Oscillospiraceae bacterium]MBQ7129431.1 lipolytic enzyme, G-D-S-L [Oscillospiraceae bacterium]
MKKHIVCLGDSNTHGYCADPADCADGGIRFNEDERWTRLLQKQLGEGYLVIEEGLSGRTTCFDDPIHEGLNALNYIYPCLKSHEDVDLLIIMLGTNDTKDRFYASAACIAIGMARLVKKAMSTECWGGKKPNILVVAPPPIGEGMLTSPVAATMGSLCVKKSEELAHYYKEQCDLIGCHFLDAGALGCEFNQIDYMHLTKKGHAALAEGLAERIPQLVK